MTAPPRPYDRAVRMGDSDYPGALRPVGEGWRVSVSPDGRRYRLQPLLSGPDGDVWGSPPSLVGLTLAALVSRGAGEGCLHPDCQRLALPGRCLGPVAPSGGAFWSCRLGQD
ncbi:MAG: hypothetical protein RIQ75_1209, partial [Pseudomonadota bacterium]